MSAGWPESGSSDMSDPKEWYYPEQNNGMPIPTVTGCMQGTTNHTPPTNAINNLQEQPPPIPYGTYPSHVMEDPFTPHFTNYHNPPPLYTNPYNMPGLPPPPILPTLSTPTPCTSAPPPPLPHYPNVPGYGWGGSMPPTHISQPLTQTQPPQGSGPNQSWAYQETTGGHQEHISRPEKEKDQREIREHKLYRDTRPSNSRTQRYDREQRSLGDKRWPDRGQKRSRSPSEYPSSRSEGRHYSPSQKSSRAPHSRCERERDDLEAAKYKRDRKYSSESRWPDKGSSSTRSRPFSIQAEPANRRRDTRNRSSPPIRSSRDTHERSHRSQNSKMTKGLTSPGHRYKQSRSPTWKSPETQSGRISDQSEGRLEEGEGSSKKPLPVGDQEGMGVSGDDTLDSLLQKEDEEDPLEEDEIKTAWIRSSPADLYYQRDEKNPIVTRATKKLMSLCDVFEEKLVKRGKRIREEKKQRVDKNKETTEQVSTCGSECSKTKVMGGDKSDCEEKEKEEKKSEDKTEGSKTFVERNDTTSAIKSSDKETVPPIDTNERETEKLEGIKHRCENKHRRDRNTEKDRDSHSSSSNDSSSSEEEEEESEMDRISKELEKKRNHPDRLHEELWYNDPGEMNDGPLCRCSVKAQRSGIRHGYYVGEEKLKVCDPWSNNANHLHHYLITISPPTNFLIKTPTVIMHDNHEFIFEGFSLLSHHPLEEVQTCRVIRFNIEYTILYIQEKIPDNFCVQELNLLYDYLFLELLELVDLNLKAMGDPDGCPRFHFMPRFVRKLADNGKEILSMNEVLSSLLKNSGPLVQPEDLAQLLDMPQYQWQNYADQLKGMVVTCPGMKPCSIRVDQLDRDQISKETINYPVIVHFGIRPPQLSYAGNPEYQKAWREYVKFRHLLANMPKPSFEDKRKLEAKENRLQEMRMTSKMKRDVTIVVSSHGFYRTGIMCDVVQHAMLLPVLVCHLRFHQSLDVLEESIDYKFQTRFLLQLALTHPSYRENFGTNPDHARNSLTNCGIRQPEYGDRRIHYMNTRKRGINTLINIMSRFGRNLETESKIRHNERLEFLGDAVVEFLTSIHLYHLFPSLEEGGLATYRAAIVQNQHLAVLAEKLKLDQFMLYAHGSDLCHDFELRHAMANCFEALMGAIFLDSGIEEADKVLSSTLFKGESVLHTIWVQYPLHPLQEQEPYGDRKWIKEYPILKKLSKFEESIGIEFKHIRLLARAFTDRSIGYINLTLGSNQRLEFLGDTVLQLVSSEYLYRYFPEHHEGHLSLLRSSLVNNRTQAVVCDDLGMTSYAVYSHLKTELKTKDRADLLEAFLGALYIDRGLKYCRTFCQVCFFPRLHQFIMNQDWNDPKSKLQQCCLTLRTMDGGEPDIPIYKVIECKGPTNTRVYTVAVYFRGRRLAKASGHSIQQAEMNAAQEALMNSKELFPQLDHQRRVIEKSVKIQGIGKQDSQDREKDRGRERIGRQWREDERRGDKERPRDRNKLEVKDVERNRDGERKEIRPRYQSNSDTERCLDRMRLLEDDKMYSDRGERERGGRRGRMEYDKARERHKTHTRTRYGK